MRRFLVFIFLVLSLLLFSTRQVSAAVWTENLIISEFVHGTEISIGSDGFARVILQKSDLTLDYLKCTNTTCTTFTRTDLGFTNHSNYYTHAIVEGADNYSKIVATSATTGMWLISCLNADCSSQTTEQLDGTATNPRNVWLRERPMAF